MTATPTPIPKFDRLARRETLLTVGAFALLLLAPWLLWIAGVRSSAERENRPLADAPRFEAGSLADPAYYAALDDYLLDRAPGRQESAAALNVALFAVTGASPIETAFVDSEGYWFLSEDFLNPCADFRSLEVAEAFDRWGRRAEVYLAVAPDKSAILDDHFSVRGRLANNCQIRLHDEFVNMFAERREVIDLWTPLNAEPFDDPDLGPLYWKTDSHWTYRGSERFVAALLDRIQPGLYDPASTMIGDAVTNVGDVTRRLGLERVETVPSLVSVRPGVTTTSTVDVPPNQVRTYRSVTDGTMPLITGRTVVIVDSMGQASVNMLNAYFETLVFVHWDELTPGVVDRFIAGADRVIFEVVQRDLVFRSETKLLTPDFDESLSRALSGQN